MADGKESMLELLVDDYRIATKAPTESEIALPSGYRHNFNKKYNSFLSYFPENSSLRNNVIGEIKKSIKELHNDGEALSDISGEINDSKFGTIQSNACKKLKSKYPNLNFDNLNSIREQYDQQTYTVTKNEDSNENKFVDFNNPEDRKTYLKSIFDEYTNLKTDAEKEEYKRNNFAGYDKYKKEIDLTCEYFEEMAKIKAENPEIDDEKCSREATRRTGITEEEITIGLMTKKISEIEEENKKIKKGSSEWKENKKEIARLYAEIDKMKEKEKDENLKNNDDLKGISNADIELENILNAETEEEQENDDLKGISNADIELENILNAETEEEQENDDLEKNITEEETFDISDTLDNVENEHQKENKDVHYNSILGQAGEEEIKKEEANSDKIQTQETALVEYNPNRLRNFFNNIINKIKESNLFKRISGKIEKNLTENNNFESKLQQDDKEKSSFNDRLIVSKEEQAKNRRENEKNNVKSETVSISFGDRSEK